MNVIYLNFGPWDTLRYDSPLWILGACLTPWALRLLGCIDMHWLTSFILSFIHFICHSFFQSIILSFFIHSFISFIHYHFIHYHFIQYHFIRYHFIHSFIHSSIHPSIHSFIQSFIHSFHSFIQSWLIEWCQNKSWVNALMTGNRSPLIYLFNFDGKSTSVIWLSHISACHLLTNNFPGLMPFVHNVWELRFHCYPRWNDSE